MMNTLEELILDIGLGVFTATFYLLTSAGFDNIMNEYISNIISLVITMGIDFFIQMYIFTGGPDVTKKTVVRYLIVNITSLLLAHLIYVYLRKNTLTKRWLDRWISGAIIYVVFDFPLTKGWVFKK